MSSNVKKSVSFKPSLFFGCWKDVLLTLIASSKRKFRLFDGFLLSRDFRLTVHHITRLEIPQNQSPKYHAQVRQILPIPGCEIGFRPELALVHGQRKRRDLADDASTHLPVNVRRVLKRATGRRYAVISYCLLFVLLHTTKTTAKTYKTSKPRVVTYYCCPEYTEIDSDTFNYLYVEVHKI